MEHRILHVEDNSDDVVLTRMAFSKAGIPVQIDTASDGEAAVSMLEKSLQSSLPSLVLLDVKLPGKSGAEVLAWIRTQPQLRRLPVIMLTSSVLGEDINKAYDLGANSYLLKPSDLEELTSLAKAIGLYWLQTNTPASTQNGAVVGK